MIHFKNPFDTNLIKQLLKIGYPIGIAMFLEFLGFNLITILVGREAGILAATHNIGVTITSSAYVIPMSISAAIAIKVGYFNGAKNLTEIKRYSLSGTMMSVIFMAFCSVLLFLLFYLLLFRGGKLSLDFHDLFYNLNFEKEKLLLKDLFEGCLILNYYCYNTSVKIYRAKS